MKTNDLLLAFHHARNDPQKTRELIEQHCEPIENPPDVPGVLWLGSFKPPRGKRVWICNDEGQIIAQNAEDYFCE